jgi:hypothetical protein
MVNLDPDSANPAPEVLKAVVHAHQNTAGIYGAVTRIGRLAVGQTIFLRARVDGGDGRSDHAFKGLAPEHSNFEEPLSI